MLQYEKIEQCAQKGLAMHARLVDASGQLLHCRYYGVTTHGTIESFTYTNSLRRGNSITSKLASPLGYLMGVAFLSFIIDDSEA